MQDTDLSLDTLFSAISGLRALSDPIIRFIPLCRAADSIRFNASFDLFHSDCIVALCRRQDEAFPDHHCHCW